MVSMFTQIHPTPCSNGGNSRDTYSKNTVSIRNITFHYYGFNVHPIIIHFAVIKNEGILTLSTGNITMVSMSIPTPCRNSRDEILLYSIGLILIYTECRAS